MGGAATPPHQDYDSVRLIGRPMTRSHATFQPKMTLWQVHSTFPMGYRSAKANQKWYQMANRGYFAAVTEAVFVLAMTIL